MIQHRYWYRGWIIQEFVLSNNPIIVFGGQPMIPNFTVLSAGGLDMSEQMMVQRHDVVAEAELKGKPNTVTFGLA